MPRTRRGATIGGEKIITISCTGVSRSCCNLSAVRAERCLGLEKQFDLDWNPARSLRERIKSTVLQHLQEHPDATLQQLIDHVIQEHGVILKPPAMCVMRQQLSLAPDSQQSTAAKARRR